MELIDIWRSGGPGGPKIRRGGWLKPLLTLTLAAVSACAAPLSAHDGDLLVPIRFLSEETLALIDLDDGVVEDWEDVLGEPTLTTLDFDLDSPAYIDYQAGPSNFDFRIWLGWSKDGRIHCAGQFADDVHVTVSDHFDFFIHFMYRGDSIALLVDGDHSGDKYLFSADEEPLEGPKKSNLQAQRYEAVSRVPVGPLVALPEANIDGAWWMVEPPFARGGGGVFGENPTFWSVEFFVTCFDRLNHLDPGKTVVSSLFEGKVIGLDVWVHDHDEVLDDGNPRPPSGWYFLNRPDSGYPDSNDAGEFGDGLLLGPDEPGDSAVQSNTWGRIKASLD